MAYEDGETMLGVPDDSMDKTYSRLFKSSKSISSRRYISLHGVVPQYSRPNPYLVIALSSLPGKHASTWMNVHRLLHRMCARGCDERNFPGSYTRVARHLTWIEEKTTSVQGVWIETQSTCPGITCHDGRCIYSSKRCNGFVDCLEGEDETGCRRRSSNERKNKIPFLPNHFCKHNRLKNRKTSQSTHRKQLFKSLAQQ